MPASITTITKGGVNCYLVKNNGSFLMIDTGLPKNRAEIEKVLDEAGCTPENLKLIVLTHGDYDHAGNAAHLRVKFGTKIALHPDEWQKVEKADWNWGFKPKPDRFLFPMNIVSKLIKAGPFDTFTPDIATVDGQSLSEFGFEASIVDIPGHTKGSISILIGNDFFCGDLFDNMSKPRLQFFIDDMTAADASVKKLKKLSIETVYPGHGKVFAIDAVL